MPRDARGSVTQWIGALKAGDHDAAQKLWERYFERLVRLAGARLRATGRTGADQDGEDAALSAFDSFCAGVASGRFPRLGDRDDLWPLLAVIATRKALDQVERQGRQKRGGGQVLGESALEAGSGPAGLDQFVGPEPPPEVAAMVAEEFQRLLDALGDETLRRIALGRLEGFTNDEIAAQLGCTRRTVVNKLKLIRTTWKEGAS